MQKETDNWYTSWFDTPYYHILYKDRDYDEAGFFMKRITSFLGLSKDAEILDLACGKGRHSKYLNTLGYKVIGADLSPRSIAYAKQFENERLQFVVHDMCQPFSSKFDAIFNLFTSFGYFESEEDNVKTIKAIKNGLKTNGYGVIDFLNVHYVAKHLIPSETKTVEDIDFHIERHITDGYIYKDIRFQDNGQQYSFTERVKALTLTDFLVYFEEAGVSLRHCFGDYHLQEFDQDTSERLILIFN
ncbi:MULTISPECIES: class I SAM-dependent methyltransferase [Altibacter]|uniref:class I SAM-dependent methyltransferase n=1 Tax=Altibacter TaxID=1535231 RepID=UPI000557A526|nr:MULTISPECIES: class I SAM-dependent methyltransferase [Altibacter]MCW8980432.1 class I SAM-dependent methyltransferase [Altibacter sp.]MCW9036398.1 class I SAM-dependent methyltransferase [Altibacter sp.]